jgi:NitT/TauT family transport system substrate-binding protein
LESCVTIVLHHGPTLGKGHMTWMLNEVNALIWPSPLGLGIMDPAAFAQTVEIAQAYELLQKTPDLESYRSDLAHRALDGLKHQGLDIEGQGFRRRPVPITPGGE